MAFRIAAGGRARPPPSWSCCRATISAPANAALERIKEMDRDANIATAIASLTLLVARIAKAAEDAGGIGLEQMRAEIKQVLDELADSQEDLGQIVLRRFLEQTRETPSIRSALIH
jgi:hypothetical protein